MPLDPLIWQRELASKTRKRLLKLYQKADTVVRQLIIDGLLEIDLLINQLDEKGDSSQVRTLQYEFLQQELAQKIKSLWGNVETLIKDKIETVTQMSVESNKAMLKILTRSVGRGDAAILADSLAHSAEVSFQNIRSRILNGIDLSQAIYNNTALMQGKIDDIVNTGIIGQRSAREIAADVAQYVNPDVMGGVRYSAMRLSRTELNNAAHATSIQTYAESPYVEGVLWNLSGSHSIPDDCDEFDGQVFPKEAVPFKPHPQCFCFLTPITPSAEEFLDNMENGKYDCAR